MKCEVIDWYGSDKRTSGSLITPLNVKKRGQSNTRKAPNLPCRAIVEAPPSRIDSYVDDVHKNGLDSCGHNWNVCGAKWMAKDSIGEYMPQSI